MEVKQILLIRMLDLSDVVSIGIPAVRYFKQQFPQARITLLTYGAGQDIMRLAEPELDVMVLGKDQWPENIIPAMESFLGLAEKIVGVGYDQIINLDTCFMPCFMSRFLKDAGENVSGNMMNISVQELIDQFQDQTLKPEYVNDAASYMQSSFFGMSRWHSHWWESSFLPDNGYPEFYLRFCCGFDQLEMNWNISVKPDHQLKKMAKKQKVIALAPQADNVQRSYPYAEKLQQLLEQDGFHVWNCDANDLPLRNTLAKLTSSDLLVTAPSPSQWLASTVNCPSLVICADIDPRTLMPDYATDPGSTPIAPEALLESIQSIFEEEEHAAD